MSVAFDRIWAILQNNSNYPLSPEVEEVCKLSPEQYAAIWQVLPYQDQAALTGHYQRVAACVRSIPREDSTKKEELISNAVEGLLFIRDYQNRQRLTEGLEFNMDKVFLELAYYTVPRDKRREAVRLVLDANLPEASQRHAALTLLHHFGNQSFVLEVARVCRNSERVATLIKYILLIRSNQFLMTMLAPMLTRFSPDYWAHIYDVCKDRPLITIPQAASLLQVLKSITSEEFCEVLTVVKSSEEDPRLVMQAVPLFNLCDEGSHAARILKEVVELLPRHRSQVLEQTIRQFPVSTDSSIIYMVLLQQKDIALQLELARGVEAAPLKREFIVNPDELIKCPEILLGKFIEFVNSGDLLPEAIAFSSSRERGIGFAKEFVSKLVEELTKKLRFTKLSDGRMRPEQAKLTREEEEVYQNIGRLFMYCMKHNLVIGMQLDPGLFAALASLNEDQLYCDITEDTLEVFFPLYKAMKSHYEDDKRSVGLMEQNLHDQDIREVLLEAMPQAITPCIAIYNGMEIEEGISAGELEKRIQGTVSAQTILNQLRFGTGIDEINGPLIKAWIRKLDENPKKLLKFLSIVTGTTGLGPSPIHIEISGISIQAHICTQLLSLPSTMNIEEALVELDKAIERENYFDKIK